MIITATKFLTCVEAIAAEAPSYRVGGCGDDGTCDCIGLIIGAIRWAGGSWRGLHGSNYAARYETNQLRKIDHISELKIGEAVYKARDPGEDKYALPDRYKKAPDLRDYYHVGVVESVTPLRIRHMTTPQMQMDTKIGKWTYHGWLKKITESEGGQDEKIPETGGGKVYILINIAGGNVNAPINMRSGDSLNRKIIKQIPQGSEAELIEHGESWCKIRYKGAEGFVATQFVHVQESSSGSGGTSSADDAGSTVAVDRKQLEALYDTIGDWLGLRG